MHYQFHQLINKGGLLSALEGEEVRLRLINLRTTSLSKNDLFQPSLGSDVKKEDYIERRLLQDNYTSIEACLGLAKGSMRQSLGNSRPGAFHTESRTPTKFLLSVLFLVQSN